MLGNVFVTFELENDVYINPYAAGGLFGQNKMMQKTWKNDWNPVAHGYSSESAQRELSYEYQHDRVKMIFRNIWNPGNIGTVISRV